MVRLSIPISRRPYAEERIYGQISDITISMKSTDHLKMPELISSEYEVHLSDDEVTRYEELKQELVLELPDGEITVRQCRFSHR